MDRHPAKLAGFCRRRLVVVVGAAGPDQYMARRAATAQAASLRLGALHDKAARRVAERLE